MCIYLLKLTIILTTIGLPVMMSVIGPVMLLFNTQTTLHYYTALCTY